MTESNLDTNCITEQAVTGTSPRVSVLIPVYNAEEYLRECLDSVLAQSFTDFELILCDDGSRDRSADICEAYAAKDKRVRVMRQENTGNTLARYNLIDAACGDYVQFVDADDTVPPDMLEKLAAFAQSSGADIVCFGYTVTDDDGAGYKTVTGVFPDGAVYSGDGKIQVYREFVSDWRLNTIWAKFFKRELFYAVNDRPKVRKNLNGEDRFLTAGLLEKAQCIGYLSGPMYNYRLSKNGMSRHFKLDFLLDTQFVNEYVLSLMDDMGIAGEEESVAGFYRYNARDIVSYIYETARDRIYTKKDLLEAYGNVLETEMCSRVRREVDDYNCGSKLQRLIYKAFKAHAYGRAIALVRLAAVLKLVRRV